jgi:hypothetical protein
VGEHAGRIGDSGEQAAHDPQPWFLPATLDDLAPRRAFEPGNAAAAGADQGRRRRGPR